MLYRWLIILIATMNLTAQADHWSLQIYSEQYPPLNYINEQGKPTGVVYDLLVLMLRDMGRADLIDGIEFVPWARGYHEAQTRPNTMLFSMIRNPEREQDFIWVGPVTTTQNYLVGSKKLLETLSNPVQADELLELTVGVVRQDFGELLMREHPILRFTKQEVVSTPRQAALMLEAGRIDLWSYGFPAAEWIMRDEGIDVSKFVSVYPMGGVRELYFSFNPQTDPKAISAFREALERVKRIDPNTGRSILQEVEQRYPSMQTLQTD